MGDYGLKERIDDVEADVAVVDAIVDNIHDTDLPAVKTDTAAILVDTADMQPKLGTPAADVSADIAAVKVDTAAILVDTATLYQKATKSITLSLAAVPVTENLFTVTGEVEVIVIGYIDTAVTSGGALTLEVGIAGDTAGLIVQTAVGALLIDKLWVDNSPGTLESVPSAKLIANSATIIHTIAGVAATAGAITYYCWWKALSADGAVAAA